MSEPDDTAPPADPRSQMTPIERRLLLLGPLLMGAIVVALVVRATGGVPLAEVAGVLLVSAAVGAVLVRALAGLRAAVPVYTVGLLLGMVLVGGVLDRDEWLVLFFVGYLGGPLLVGVDTEKRDARRRT